MATADTAPESSVRDYLSSLWSDVSGRTSDFVSSTPLIPFKDAIDFDFAALTLKTQSPPASEVEVDDDTAVDGDADTAKSGVFAQSSIYSQVGARAQSFLKELLVPRVGRMSTPPQLSLPWYLQFTTHNKHITQPIYTYIYLTCGCFSQIGEFDSTILLHILRYLPLSNVILLERAASGRRAGSKSRDDLVATLCADVLYDRTYVRKCAHRGFIDRKVVWPWLISCSSVQGFHDLYIVCTTRCTVLSILINTY